MLRRIFYIFGYILMIFTLVVAAVSCSDRTNGDRRGASIMGSEGGACFPGNICENDLECASGICRQPAEEVEVGVLGDLCSDSEECREGLMCMDGECIPREITPGTMEEGEFCFNDSSCVDGLVCLADSTCGVEDVMYDYVYGLCSADGDCEDGYECERGKCRLKIITPLRTFQIISDIPLRTDDVTDFFMRGMGN